MAALLKSFASKLLFLWALLILANFASGQKADVIFEVTLAVEEGNVLKIVGNSSELGNGNVYNAPVMIRIYDDHWILIVILTVEEAYEVSLAFNNCTCTANEPYTFYLRNGNINKPINLTGYFNCDPCLVPSPPPPSPSPPPPSPPPPSPSPPPPSPSPPPPSPSPPPPSPSPPPPSPPPPSPSPPPPSPSPPPPSPSPPPPSPPPPVRPDADVIFVVNKTLEGERVFKIVGNTSVLGDGNIYNAPVMNKVSDNFWELPVVLVAGETYEVNLGVNDCYCTADEPYVFTAEATYQIVNLTSYFDCSNCNPLPTKSLMFAVTDGVLNMFSYLK